MSYFKLKPNTEPLKYIPRIRYSLYHVYYETRRFAPSSFKFLYYNYSISNFVCYLDTHFYLIVMRTSANHYLVFVRDKCYKFKTKRDVLDFLHFELDVMLNEYQYTLDSINHNIK